MSRSIFALALVLALAAPAPAADLAVRLVDVPQQLSFPLPPGANQVLTALVKGGPPRSVWLAGEEKALARVMLVKVDDGEWQVNLAEPAVNDLARGAGGKLQVFAEAADGKIAASLPIRYELQNVYTPPPQILVVGPDGKASANEWLAWCDPAKVARLEARRTQAGSGALIAAAGPKRFPFAGASLEMTDEIRAAWSDAGQLEIAMTEPGGAIADAFRVLRAIPGRLAFPGNLAKVTVSQRSAEPVPGTRDYLVIELGDVTRGEVLVTVRAATGELAVSSLLMKQGTEIAVPLGQETCHIEVERLANVLAGNDYAVFRISPFPAEERAAIERLLTALEGAAAAVVIDGKENPPASVRARFEHQGPRVANAADFIEKLGQGAIVRLRDGGPAKPLAAWWKEQK